jgi:tetratricopeptide (TPR) repeat protein
VNCSERTEGLRGDPRRRADSAVRGFVYQFWRTVEAWITLGPEEVLYVEGAEDFDRVRAPSQAQQDNLKIDPSQHEATAVQVKDNAASGTLTLGSRLALDALGNFWQLRGRNPSHLVSFQYVTTATVGRERDGSRAGLDEGECGIELWAECRLAPRAELVFDRIERLRSFLLSRDRLEEGLSSFLRAASAEDIYHQLVKRFEWVPDEPGLAEVRSTVVKKLIDGGWRRGVSAQDCERAALELYTRVEQVAIDPNRPALTQQEFITIFDGFALIQLPRAAALVDSSALTQRMVGEIAVLLGAGAAPTLQVPDPLADRFPAPILGARRWRRETLIARIAEIASQRRAVHIHGGVGMGKTTLVRQAVEGGKETILWADFRGRTDASMAASTCAELCRAVDAATTPTSVILDDFEIKAGDPRLIETEASLLAATVQRRGGVLYTIAHNPLPPRLAVAVGLARDGAVAVPPFDVNEVAAFIADLGCCDLDRASQLARVVILHTSGHPQLVAARVFALEADGFPPIRASDLLEKPQDVIDERGAARSLIRAALPEPARDLLYRLSIMLGIFKRSDALRIAALDPPVPRAGENLEILTGAWLERPAEGYSRVSPLAAEAGQEIFTPEGLTSLHGNIAACLLADRSIDIHEFSMVLMHSIAGRAEEVLFLLPHLFMTAPAKIRQELADELTWIPIIGIGQGTRLPFESLATRLMFRLMQWQIAGRSGREHLAPLAAVMEAEFSNLPEEPRWRLMRHLYLAQRLMQVEAPMPADEVISKALELAHLTEVIATDPETNSAINIPKLPTVGRRRSTILEWFSVFVSASIRLPEDVAKLTEALDALDAAQRAKFLAAFDEAELRLLFGRPWLSLRGRPAHDYEAFCELLQGVLEAGRKWEDAPWCRAVARQLAIALDNNLDRREEAARVLDAAAAEWGDAVTLRDARATFAFERGDYADALEIWRGTLGLWPYDNADLQPAISTRNAAVSAMHLEYWSEAEELFDSAERRAAHFKRPAWSIGLAADAAHSAWTKGQNNNIGDLSSAVGRFSGVVQRLERLPNDPEDLSGYFVHKTVTALLLWLSRDRGAAVSAQVTWPELGLCSQLDINPRVADLPPNPIDYAWLALYWLSRQVTGAAFESQSTEITEAIRGQEHALQTMNESRFAPVRLFARIDATARAAQRGPFEAVIDATAKLAHEHLRIHPQSSVPLHEPDSADVEISPITAEVAEALIFPALLAALIGAGARQVQPDEITAAWRRRAKVYGEGVVGVAQRVLEVVSLPRRELERVLADGKESYERRLVAAALLCGLGDTGPVDALRAHITAFEGLVQNDVMREFASTSLAAIVRRDWRRLIGEPALLRYPRLHVDDIRSACDAPSTPREDWRATARILLSALPAVDLMVRDRLRSVANGPTPVSGRIDWTGGQRPATEQGGVSSSAPGAR